MKKECLIVAGGKENSISSVFPEGFENVFVIACDKGFLYCKNQNIPVDYACGDFDSCSQDLLKEEKFPSGVEILPTHKDDTDLIHAIKYALSNGFQKIMVTCAGGGRTDHLFSNIQALVFAKTSGAGENSYSGISEVSLFDDLNEIIVLQNEEKSIPRRPDYSLTVLSFSDKSEGVSISGAEYEVSEVTLTNCFPLGQSNEWKADSCSVSVRNGILLVIMSKV